MTKKLYWENSHLVTFQARIEDVFEREGKTVVVLDETAFYPEGGGQPCDTGRIASERVASVTSDEDGRILHHLESRAGFEIGLTVEGEIDWKRRREMMQQHTGQHILSQAFFSLYGAETRGFRITDRVAEIDLAIEESGEIRNLMARAEDAANEIVFEDREVRSYTLSPEEAARLPLRKESFITDCVRVVEIEDFDYSPCGGTHARRTGEVGLIAVRGWERAKQMLRVRFVCGVRALADYRASNELVDALARRFTVGREEVEASVERLADENKALTRRVRELAQLAAAAEARELIEAAKEQAGRRVVARIFEGRDIEELKLLAHRLVEEKGVVALLATRQAGASKLVFARAGDLNLDMNRLMRRACEELGGRGGGRPEFAQGGGSGASTLDDLISRLGAECEAL